MDGRRAHRARGRWPAHVAGLDGILVPGGFGDRGIEGKIQAIRYAREQGVPYFGICLGMQCAVIEYARNVCGLAGANSTEFEPDARAQRDRPPARAARLADKGGTMRLGLYPIVLHEGSAASRPTGRGSSRSATATATRSTTTTSRGSRSAGSGSRDSGPEKQLVEIIELPDHPWFVAGQFHPEFRSRPWDPHPLFAGFVRAALDHRAQR